MKNIKDGYKKLFSDANIAEGYRCGGKRVSFKELSHFVGMKGKDYDKQQTRILIVGRAVNGWGSIKGDNAEEFSQKAIEMMQSECFNWIVFDDGILRNDDLCEDGYYYLSKSSFWRVARAIWMELSGNIGYEDNANHKWVDNIAWTNLYKIAPIDGGNPTEKMCQRQDSACKEILLAEIEEYKPTHILFITGYRYWFEWFRDVVGVELSEVKANVLRGANKNENYVETYGVTGSGVKVVVACRPEYRNEGAYVRDIVNTFEKM